MCKRTLILAVITPIVFSGGLAQSLPEPVTRLLDAEFHNWSLETYALPDTARFPNASFFLDSRARSVFKCHLNLDTIPDFAVRISMPDSTRPCEYTLAAVSKGRGYMMVRVDSSQMRYQDQMLISPAGIFVNIFGDPDSTLLQYGQMSDDGVFIKFPTDCIYIVPIVESSMYLNYVFINDRFYEIASGD